MENLKSSDNQMNGFLNDLSQQLDRYEKCVARISNANDKIYGATPKNEAQQDKRGNASSLLESLKQKFERFITLNQNMEEHLSKLETFV